MSTENSACSARLTRCSEGRVEMGRCYLVGAGEFYGIFDTRSGDFVIAADGGYDTLCRLGITPDLLIGDMDSIADTPENLPLERYPVRKDDTDMFLAYCAGVARGYTEFFLYGGTGGREDHTFSNLSLLLFAAKHGHRMTMIGRQNDFLCIYGENRAPSGENVSPSGKNTDVSGENTAPHGESICTSGKNADFRPTPSGRINLSAKSGSGCDQQVHAGEKTFLCADGEVPSAGSGAPSGRDGVFSRGRVTLSGAPGEHVSVFAFGGEAHGVSIRGLSYTAEDITLLPEVPLGASNLFLDTPGEVSVQDGALLIVTEHKTLEKHS